MIKVYLALGSNIGDPVAHLQWALAELKKLPQSQFIQVSNFLKTKPIGFLDQPDFLNAVLELDTNLSPHDLLSHILSLEIQRHRTRFIKNGPRTLDIDILLYGDLIMHTPELIIPHPRMWERDFVLIPLYEIAPHLEKIGRIG